MAKETKFINRELSWQSFNERVLQEAANPATPLIERLRFLGIFSNNRDEFFRVRVASVRRMEALGKKVKEFLGGKPKKILKAIQETVIQQQRQYESIYAEIIGELEKENIYMVNEKKLNAKQKVYVRDYFRDKVRPLLVPIMLDQLKNFPYLSDRAFYLAVKLSKKKGGDTGYAMLEVPTHSMPRFLTLPGQGKKQYVIMLDDVIRFNLDDIFHLLAYDTYVAYNVRLVRDSELDVDNDLSLSLIQKMSKGVEARKRGEPIRFIYDEAMDDELLDLLKTRMKIDEQDSTIPGGRYHNFRDFMKFPDMGRKDLLYRPITPLVSPHVEQESMLKKMKKKDFMLFYPYDSFDPVIDFMREAAIDPQVRSVQLTLYRAAEESRVINALISAARNGKQVTCVLELQARFNEEANIKFASDLQEAGVNVLFGVPQLKVHCKLLLVSRKEPQGLFHYAYISTGNFNENTARVYTDCGLFTADQRLTQEVSKMFSFMANPYKSYRYSHLIASPISLRKRLIKMINQEIINAGQGKKATIWLKMNSISDPDMIRKLYEASKAGVKINMIVRGICCLVPGEEFSKNIQVHSIIDRYLEHARVFIFENGGDQKYFIASSDFMTRNLDRRIEVCAPIYDKSVQRLLEKMMDLQWKDNVKGRLLNKDQTNGYFKGSGPKKIRSQEAFYEYLASAKPR